MQNIDNKFIEVAVMTRGMCFGEAALLSNQPRTASIKCTKDCHFGILSRQNYNMTIATIQKQNIINKVEFIQQCPSFQRLSKAALLKLHYFWKPQVYYMGQTLYKQGHNCTQVYLIRQGEFEQFIDFVPSNEKKINTHHFTGPSKKWSKVMQNTLKAPKKNLVSHCSLLGKGMLMGDDDCIAMSKYTKSAKCVSQKA